MQEWISLELLGSPGNPRLAWLLDGRIMIYYLRLSMERSSKDPFLGQMVGSYRLVEQIGQGGMGQVYRAVHGSIGQVVAVKVLGRNRAEDPRSHERFLKEAKLLSQLQHPGLVQVFDFGQLPSGDSYIMMELLAGESLRTLLRARQETQTALSMRLALAITGQVASALPWCMSAGSCIAISSPII